MYETPRYNETSKFWMDDDEYQNLSKKYSFKPSLTISEMVEKATILKTISNFVNIVTNQPIPIHFEGQEAKTNGKEIFISADVKDFDSVCGLSLHEASHIKHSKKLHKILETAQLDLSNLVNNSLISNPLIVKISLLLDNWKKPTDFTTVSKTYNYVFELINILEDFRIDSISMQNFPGYKGYYDALETAYMYTPKMEKALRSDPKLSEESFFSYKINLSCFTRNHPDNNLMKLKGGLEISNILDKEKILTKSALDIMDMAFDIIKIIYKYVIENKKPEHSDDSQSSKSNKKSKSQKSGDNKSDQSDSDLDDNEQKEDNKNSSKNEDEPNGDQSKNNKNSDGNESNEDEQDDYDLDQLPEDEDESDEDGNNETNDSDNKDDSPDPLEQLDNDISQSNSITFKKLLDAIKGKYNKTRLNSHEIIALNLFSNNMFKIKKTIVKDHEGNSYNVDVIVINKLEENILKYVPEIASSSGSREFKVAIQTGINLGRALGNKLQLMNDTHIDRTIRKKSGNLDNRLLSEIGHGNTKIFSRMHIDQYEKQFVHISIDSSSSMTGSNFRNSLQMAANIASAAKSVNGMRVQVTIRSTTSIDMSGQGKIRTSAEVPYVIIIYDSKFDDMNHIIKLWPRLECPGITPEAICFDAIKDIILESSKDKNSYFVNISDGSPCFSTAEFSYRREFYTFHTREVMRTFRNAGLKVISYFIDGGRADRGHITEFIGMYGNDAQFIDVQNISEIARTLNKRFLAK